MMSYEQLRISRNRAYVEYLHAEDITEKSVLLARWKMLCLAAEDAYREYMNIELR